MKQLEGELGVELFERLSRGVRLTAAGGVLLERGRALLSECDRAIAATRLAGQGKSGFLKVGFADGATYSGLVPAIISAFRKSTPHVELELVPASSASQAELLSQGSIDIGFVYWLPNNHAHLQYYEIGTEKVLLAIAESNALARRKKIPMKDLQDAPFIWFKRANAPMFFDLIGSRCSRAGWAMNVAQEAFTESTMLSLVSADIGVTFITEAARRRKPENVVLIEVEDLDVTINLRALWRVKDRSPALREFLEAVRSSGKPIKRTDTISNSGYQSGKGRKVRT